MAHVGLNSEGFGRFPPGRGFWAASSQRVNMSSPSIAHTSAADRRNRFSVYFPGCHTGGLPEGLG